MRGDRTADIWRDFAPLGAVIAIGVVLAFSAFVTVRGHYQTVERQQFRRNATYYSTSFKDDVARHVTSLAAIRAFVSASREVTRWEFSNYAHQILPQNAGFRAVLWVPRIAQPNRQAYETALQQDGLYGLRIRELTDQGQIVAAADRATYLPISYVEPFEGNDTLVGLDLSGIARFAELFRAAEQGAAPPRRRLPTPWSPAHAAPQSCSPFPSLPMPPRPKRHAAMHLACCNCRRSSRKRWARPARPSRRPLPISKTRMRPP